MIALVERALRSLPDMAAAGGGEISFLLRDGGDGPRDTSQVILFAPGGRPLLVAKVARGVRGHASLEREHRRLQHLAKTLLVQQPGAAPRPLGLVSEGDLAVLLESHVPGKRLKDLKPGELEGPAEPLERVLDWLLAFTVASGLKRAPTEEVIGRVEVALRDYRAAFAPGAREEQLLANLVPGLRETLGPETALVPSHGDFSDANILVQGASLSVIDWDEPEDYALPGADLFYLLCSLAATRHGLQSRPGFEHGFRQAFLVPGETSRRFRRAWERYRAGLGLPAAAGLALFAAAWVEFALRKLRYLEERSGPAGSGRDRSLRLTHPQDHYPVTFFADGRCLNLALTAEHPEAFAL